MVQSVILYEHDHFLISFNLFNNVNCVTLIMQHPGNIRSSKKCCQIMSCTETVLFLPVVKIRSSEQLDHRAKGKYIKYLLVLLKEHFSREIALERPVLYLWISCIQMTSWNRTTTFSTTRIRSFVLQSYRPHIISPRFQ